MSGKDTQRSAQPSTCEGKEPFTSYTLAAEIAKKRSRHGKKNHVYRCGTCNKFHLGSVQGTGMRRRHDVLIDDDEVFA